MRENASISQYLLNKPDRRNGASSCDAARTTVFLRGLHRQSGFSDVLGRTNSDHKPNTAQTSS
jgi:hypothetical protein